jgi:N-methylhydantoinase B/oxoprolinase/acetone carboxylase alpha subunit
MSHLCHATLMSKQDKSQTVEQGDIFFFYRPKVGKVEVEDIEDVQRFYRSLLQKMANIDCL